MIRSEVLMRLYDLSLDLESDRLFDRIELLEEQLSESQQQISEKDEEIRRLKEQLAKYQK